MTENTLHKSKIVVLVFSSDRRRRCASVVRSSRTNTPRTVQVDCLRSCTDNSKPTVSIGQRCCLLGWFLVVFKTIRQCVIQTVTIPQFTYLLTLLQFFFFQTIDLNLSLKSTQCLLDHKC